MPPEVAVLPWAERAWHDVMDGQTRFRRSEVGLVAEYCVASAMAMQALSNMTNPDGTLQTTVQTSSGNVVKNPEVAVWQQAVNQMRQISGVLGLDTLTAARLQLTKVASTSLAADLPRKIRETMEALDAG